VPPYMASSVLDAHCVMLDTNTMLFQALAMDPALQIGAAIFGLALAVICHEVAHGYVALKLGDPTAYYAGRLTLNPIPHIDLWGTILIPLFLFITNSGFMFGWAKPVPVNYYNLRHGKYGPVLVALAGPATNLVLLIIAALLARFMPQDTALPFFFLQIALINGVLMLFNLIPIPPLDGSKVLYLFLERRPDIIQWLERYGLFLMLFLLLFGSRFLSQLVFGPAVRLVQAIAGF
jgi:Zn-dependent protease